MLDAVYLKEICLLTVELHNARHIGAEDGAGLLSHLLAHKIQKNRVGEVGCDVDRVGGRGGLAAAAVGSRVAAYVLHHDIKVVVAAARKAGHGIAVAANDALGGEQCAVLFAVLHRAQVVAGAVVDQIGQILAGPDVIDGGFPLQREAGGREVPHRQMPCVPDQRRNAVPGHKVGRLDGDRVVGHGVLGAHSPRVGKGAAVLGHPARELLAIGQLSQLDGDHIALEEGADAIHVGAAALHRQGVQRSGRDAGIAGVPHQRADVVPPGRGCEGRAGHAHGGLGAATQLGVNRLPHLGVDEDVGRLACVSRPCVPPESAAAKNL